MKRKVILATVGLLAGAATTLLLPPGLIPELGFGEHYHWLFYSLIIALRFSASPLAPLFLTAGVPPFVEELFQSHPFDLGSSKFPLSFSAGLVLLAITVTLARRGPSQKRS